MTKKLLLLSVTAQMLLALPTIHKLKEGESIDGTVKYKERLYYSVPVSANSALKVKLTNLNADIDLYVAEDRLPAIKNNDCYSANSYNKNEECTVTIANNTSIKAKEVKILVYGFKSSDFTLTTVREEAKYPDKLTLGEGVQKHINFNASKDFEFKGEKGLTYDVTLDKLSADADLRVKVGKKANIHTFDCKSIKGGKNEERCTIKLKSDDTIYINVFGYRDANYQITIKEEVKNTPITLAKLKEMIANGEDVTKVNTSQITDMSNLFNGNKEFNQDISGWDVSKVTNMSGMFYIAAAFNQPIGNWNVSKVTNMKGMFNFTVFNQDISKWNVSNVTNMRKMFSSSSFNQDISNWDVSNVTNMSGIFHSKGCGNFNQNIEKWNVSKVTNMDSMLPNNEYCKDIKNANLFKNHDLSVWDVSSVTTHIGFMNHGAKYNITEPKWKDSVNLFKQGSDKATLENGRKIQVLFKEDVSSDIAKYQLIFKDIDSSKIISTLDGTINITKHYKIRSNIFLREDGKRLYLFTAFRSHENGIAHLTVYDISDLKKPLKLERKDIRISYSSIYLLKNNQFLLLGYDGNGDPQGYWLRSPFAQIIDVSNPSEPIRVVNYSRTIKENSHYYGGTDYFD